MANKPLKPCKHPGCIALTRDGWCARHKPPEPQRKRSADYHGWYYLPIWRDKLRPEHLIREPFCRECAAAGIRTRATVVDHVIPHEGEWALFVDPENLQSLCKFHHDGKTMRELNSGRKVR